MNIEEFENSLKRGDRVEVRWTDTQGIFRGEGVILFVNKKSFSVALVEGNEFYKKGRRIMIPRCNATNWRENNRIIRKKEKIF